MQKNYEIIPKEEKDNLDRPKPLFKRWQVSLINIVGISVVYTIMAYLIAPQSIATIVAFGIPCAIIGYITGRMKDPLDNIYRK